MDFLDNKKILFVVAGVVLVLAIATAGVFYWQKVYAPLQEAQTPLDMSQGAVKAKCIEDVGKMTDEKLTDEVNTLKYPEKPSLQEGQDRISYVVPRMADYLICKMKYDRKEDDYDRAKAYIEKLIAQAGEKEWLLLRKNRIEEFRDNFDSSLDDSPLALESINLLCTKDNNLKPEYLKTCLDFAEKYKDEISPKELEQKVIFCKNTCKIIDKYKDDLEGLESYLLVGATWPTDKSLLEKTIFGRIELAFRLGGGNFALKIYNNILGLLNLDEQEKENYQNHIARLNYMKDCRQFNYGGKIDCGLYQECAEIRQNVIQGVCQVDIN